MRRVTADDVKYVLCMYVKEKCVPWLAGKVTLVLLENS